MTQAPVRLDLVRDLAVGSRLEGRAQPLTLARVLAFSGGPVDEPGWPQRNLHTDIDKAHEAGLDHIIASGTQSEGLLIGFLIDMFGSDWYGHGELEVRFRAPVRVGDSVRPVLRCTDKSILPGALRVSVECWCEVADGTRVIDGTATCVVAGPAVSTGA
jgi:hypothetical protein